MKNSKVKNIQSCYQQAAAVWSDWRKEAVLNYSYVAGEQIDDETLKVLREQNRPALVRNRIAPIIVAIAGTFENNMPFMQAVPKKEGDAKGADFHTRLVSDWAMKNCNADHEFARASVDSGICGIGWLKNYWSWRNEPTGKHYTESVDPLMVLLDPLCRKEDATDAHYIMVSGWYSADEIINIYRKHIEDKTVEKIHEVDSYYTNGLDIDNTKPTSWSERLLGSAKNVLGNSVKDFYDLDPVYVDPVNGLYRVIEFHDRRYVNREVIYNPETRDTISLRGKKDSESKEEYESYKLQEFLKSPNSVIVKMEVEEMWMTAVAPGLLPEEVLMEIPYDVQNRGFSLKPVFCYNFHPDITKNRGVVSDLRGPQDSHNQRHMTTLEILMDAVHPNYMAREGSIPPDSLDQWTSKERGIVKFFRGEKAPEPQAAPGFAAQIAQTMAEEDADYIQTQSVMSLNARGQSETGSESGKLFNQRVKQSMTMMAWLAGNATRAMRECFSYTDRELQVYLTGPRAVRILSSKGNSEWLQINQKTLDGVMNDVREGEYDFIIDTTKLGQSQKELLAQKLIGVAQMIPPELQLIFWSKALPVVFDTPEGEEVGEIAAKMLNMKMGQEVEQHKQQQEAGKLKMMQETGKTMGLLNSVASA